MNKSIAILQSNYIPWKGYFDIINSVDEFVIYDAVQYTKNDWRNRNLIKTNQGVSWLTIPVNASISQNIEDIHIANSVWRKKHWNSIKQAYSKSQYFKAYQEIFEHLYLNENETSLSKINIAFINTICNILNITTKISNVSDYQLVSTDRTAKLIELCNKTNSSTYLSGPSAQSYLDERMFEKNNLSVAWADYNGYPKYPQLHGEYVSQISVIDLLFNHGVKSKAFMKSFSVKDTP